MCWSEVIVPSNANGGEDGHGTGEVVNMAVYFELCCAGKGWVRAIP